MSEVAQMNSVERMRIAAVQKRVNASFEHGCGDCDCDLCFLLAVLSRTTQPGQAESTMSMQKACETIAEKEIKKWYSHSEGARAAHNIWSKIRALAARPKEQPK
jgi:hypothetical protein